LHISASHVLSCSYAHAYRHQKSGIVGAQQQKTCHMVKLLVKRPPIATSLNYIRLQFLLFSCERILLVVLSSEGSSLLSLISWWTEFCKLYSNYKVLVIDTTIIVYVLPGYDCLALQSFFCLSSELLPKCWSADK
jgi:hypothetical protein